MVWAQTGHSRVRWVLLLVGLMAAASPAAAQTAPPRVLYFSHSAGFVHTSRVHAGAVLAQLGQTTGSFDVTISEDVAMLDAATLATFDALVFFTSGELPLTEAQKIALLDFVRNGKGFVGVHSATDTFHSWPDWIAVIGGEFDTHPWDQPVTIRVEDQGHRAMRHLGSSFAIADEIYQFRAWSRASVHVLMSLDTASVPPSGTRPDNDYALAWTKPFGLGRVFYTALGHYDATWDDPRFRQHVLEGVLWAIGDGDFDGDGLTDAWERAYGLDPYSSAGAQGALADPDGDGRTNAQEQQDDTHPRGFHRRYLAEGAINAFFDVRLAVMNVSATSAFTQLRYLQPGGAVLTERVVAAPMRPLAFTRSDLAGLISPDFSTVVESDQPFALDRTMWWDASGYGSHAETSIPQPSASWYLAEGATGDAFSLFYLLQNPNPVATTATVTFLLPGGVPPLVRPYPLSPTSRTTIEVDSIPQLENSDVSASISATAPIIVERAMYRSLPDQPFAAGHGSAAVTAPSLNWFLAEGATGSFFDLFILLANPGPTPAEVSIDYLLTTGETYTKSYSVAGSSRATVWVDQEQIPADSGVRPLSDAAVSAVVRSTNNVPIVVERTMWWPGPGLTDRFWSEAHNSPGATVTGTRWALADGEVGGPQATETYVLIANTSAYQGTALVTVAFADSVSVARSVVLPPRSRTTVAISSLFPEAVGRRFGTLVESVGTTPAEIVVERAMYTSPGGVTWAAGTNVLATRLP